MKFPRGDGPLVSVFVPTRGRIGRLLEAIDSLWNMAAGPDQVEVMVKADEDDVETVEALEKMHVPVKMLVLARGQGYHDLHHWMNAMARTAKGDWLLMWNDDARMATEKWDTVLGDLDVPLGCVPEVCCFSLVDPVTVDGFMFLRRSVSDLLGRYSASPHCDTYIKTLMPMVGAMFVLPVVVDHRIVQDQTRRDGDEARANQEYGAWSASLYKEKLIDAAKLQKFIDTRRKT